MIYGLYQSAGGMMTQEYRQDLIANNLANAETIGFKREIAVFAERGTAPGFKDVTPDELQAMTGGVWLGRTATDYSEAKFTRTSNPLDIAIAGPGFLQVQVNKESFLTRDGRLMLSPEGRLVAQADGAAVLDESGEEIVLNPRGGRVTIDEDGQVQQDGQERARLAVVVPQNYEELQKQAGGRFRADSKSLSDSPARLLAEHLENAGVEPIRELATMLEASRAYQMNAQMISLQDQTVGRLISAVTA